MGKVYNVVIAVAFDDHTWDEKNIILQGYSDIREARSAIPSTMSFYDAINRGVGKAVHWWILKEEFV